MELVLILGFYHRSTPTNQQTFHPGDRGVACPRGFSRSLAYDDVTDGERVVRLNAHIDWGSIKSSPVLARREILVAHVACRREELPQAWSRAN